MALRFVSTACILLAALPARAGVSGLVADLDGDGKLDTIVAKANGQRVVGRIRANVQLSSSPEPFAIEFLAAESSVSVHLRDVDGDNQPDLIFFGTQTNRTAAIWLNRGSGVFIEAELPSHESTSVGERTPRAQWFPEHDIGILISDDNGPPALHLPIQPGRPRLSSTVRNIHRPTRTATRFLRGPVSLRAP